MQPDPAREPEAPQPPVAPQRPAAPGCPPPVPRRRRRRLLALAAVALLLLVFYRPLLTTAARLLIAEDPPAHTDGVLLLGADRELDRAASLYHAGEAHEILLVQDRPGRLQREHVLPPRVELAQRGLAARGVPEAAIRVLPGEAREDWEAARRLGAWLRDNPGVSVSALCDRFGSRRERHILDAVLGADARRVYLRAEPHRGFDETNWWRHKDGFLHLLTASIRLTYAELAGEDREPWREWDIDDYEKTLPPGK